MSESFWLEIVNNVFNFAQIILLAVISARVAANRDHVPGGLQHHARPPDRGREHDDG